MKAEEISRMKEMLDNLGADKYPREEYLHIGQQRPAPGGRPS